MDAALVRMLSHYDYSTCFVFTSLDNGWGILSDHGSIYENNWTLYEPIMAAPSVL